MSVYDINKVLNVYDSLTNEIIGSIDLTSYDFNGYFLISASDKMLLDFIHDGLDNKHNVYINQGYKNKSFL